MMKDISEPDREKGDQSTWNLHIGETKMHTQYDLLICLLVGTGGGHDLLTWVWGLQESYDLFPRLWWGQGGPRFVNQDSVYSK